MFKQISMVDTGNVNADFKLLTHNPYSVLNRLIVCQIHPSSLTTFCMQHSLKDYTVKGQASNLGVLGMSSKFQFIMTFSEKKRVMTKVCYLFNDPRTQELLNLDYSVLGLLRQRNLLNQKLFPCLSCCSCCHCYFKLLQFFSPTSTHQPLSNFDLSTTQQFSTKLDQLKHILD